jgi:hypothetical protein
LGEENAHLRSEVAETRAGAGRGAGGKMEKDKEALLRARSNEERLRGVCREQNFDLYLR